ncbi:MAG: hypothetical protein V4764_02725 [Burkholderia sp.]
MKSNTKDSVQQNTRELERAANQLGSGFSSSHSSGGKGGGGKLPAPPTSTPKGVK